jgi:Mesyanzhinovviridae DNA helicase
MATFRADLERNRILAQPEREDDFSVLLKLPSRRWMQRSRTFIIPATRVNCQYLLANMSFADQVNYPTEVMDYIKERSLSKAGNRPFPRWYAYKTQAYPDQYNAVHKCYKNNVWALLMRMGAGKSKAAVDLATAAFYEKLIKAVVVVCPNAVKPVWLADDGQISTHSPCPVVKVDVDTKFDCTIVPVDQSRLTWVVVGVESFSQGGTFNRVLPFVENTPCAVIVDESTRIKNPKAIRTQRVKALGMPAQVRGIMTGASVTKNLIDLYSQFEFLDPEIIGSGDWYAFRNRYAVMGGYKNKKILGYENVEELMQLIEPYVYICGKPQGLPPKIFTQRYVKLSDEQKDMYRKLKKAEIEEVSVANVLNRVAKLQEIVGGFLREDPHEVTNPLTGRVSKKQGKIIWTLEPDKNPKLEELVNYAEEAGDEPIVVWCKYRWELEQCHMALSKLGPAVQLHGDTPNDESEEGRTRVIQKFQGGDFKYLCSTQQVGGIGHTMVASHLMVYYSNTHSLEDRLQSEDRIHRIGQDESCLYTDLIATKTVDVLLQESIKSKKSLDEYISEQLMNASKTLQDMFGEPT